MSNARIQFSLASEDVWNAYNPQLKEGEIVTVLKANKKVKLVQGKVGGSTYSESTVIWDEDTAETTMSRAEAAAVTATAQANAASGSASKAAASQSAAATSATNAKASETAAKTSETNAKASATSAASSASSASTASTQAGKAADSASASKEAAQSAATTASNYASAARNSASEAKRYESEANSYAENAKEYAATATTKASETTAKVIEATDEANRAKAEADRAKSISDNIGNLVSDVTENNGTVTVTKSNGTQSTFMAFPQDANGTLPIAKGGTGATSAISALSNLGILDAIVNASVSGKTITFTKKDNTNFSIDTQDTNNGIVAALLEQNGYVKFSNGLILQWGCAKSNENVILPIPFANETWKIASMSTTKSYDYTPTVVSKTNRSFKPGTWGLPYDYIAIGF